jgi:hypothetical protein
LSAKTELYQSQKVGFCTVLSDEVEVTVMQLQVNLRACGHNADLPISALSDDVQAEVDVSRW